MNHIKTWSFEPMVMNGDYWWLIGINHPVSKVVGNSPNEIEVWFAGKIIELNGGFSSKPCVSLITGG